MFLIVVLSPLLLTVAAAVKLTGPGPVFFRQDRVGLNGEVFRMIKFRSMVVDAEARLDKLQDEQRDAGNVVLFKLKNDPRVTPIGRFLRRFSLDELPQLFNVVAGDMSLVGPRPPLRSEVDRYRDDERRRLLVKPGITGLWQVSGRSDLTWQDSVRLDMYYVENWSITGDLVILWKTAKAVVSSAGAYSNDRTSWPTRPCSPTAVTGRIMWRSLVALFGVIEVSGSVRSAASQARELRQQGGNRSTTSDNSIKLRQIVRPKCDRYSDK